MKRLLRYTLLACLLPDIGMAAAAPSDSRFFGTYCGDATVRHCVRYRWWLFGWHYGTKCKNIQFRNIRAELKHFQTPQGGLVNGNGSARVEGDQLGFVLAGAVTGRGLVRGSATVTGRKPHYGVARLSGDGLALTITAYNKTLTVRKDQCGNTPPSVAITSIPRTPLQYGRNYIFAGTVSDPEDLSTPFSKFEPTRLFWTYDDKHLLAKRADGLAAWSNTLPPGSRKITFRATDSGGLTASVDAYVTVQNLPPDQPTIFMPRSAATVRAGCQVRFLGQAYDTEDGWIHGAGLHWRSDVDGTIGTGGALSAKLTSPGGHSVRLTATDSIGSSSFAQQLVNVQPSAGGCPPRVRIIKPEYWKWKGMAVLSGAQQTFVGTAQDEKDMPDALSLTWRAVPVIPSGAAIALGNTMTVATTKLIAIGGKTTRYRIEFTATDSDGQKASDEMTLVVLNKPIL